MLVRRHTKLDHGWVHFTRTTAATVMSCTSCSRASSYIKKELHVVRISPPPWCGSLSVVSVHIHDDYIESSCWSWYYHPGESPIHRLHVRTCPYIVGTHARPDYSHAACKDESFLKWISQQIFFFPVFFKTFFFHFFSPIPFIVVFALLVLLPLTSSRDSDPGSHSSTTVRALHFCRKKDSAFSSIVDSRTL